MNINKDTKTPTGTTGFLTNFGTMKLLKANELYRVELRSFIHEHLNVFKEQTEMRRIFRQIWLYFEKVL